MRSTVPRSTPRIIAASVGLMLLVSGVVGLLGWKLLSQEGALVYQQERDRLGRTADAMTVAFLRRMETIESWLSLNGRLELNFSHLNHGAVVVWFSDKRIDVIPWASLLFYPAATSRRPTDPVFARVDILESNPDHLGAAASALMMLTESEDPVVRAEAMLRLARVRGKQGQLSAALSTYEALSRTRHADDPPFGGVSVYSSLALLQSRGGLGQVTGAARVGPRFDVGLLNFTRPDSEGDRRRALEFLRALETARSREPLVDSKGVPYGLLSQFGRAQLLSSAGREEEAREAARQLVSEMSSERWRLDKATFMFYDSSARAIAGLAPPPPHRLAIADEVMSLADEWQSFRRNGSPSLSRRLHRSSGAPLLGVVNANRERLVAVLAAGPSLPILGLDLESTGSTILASLVDEHGKVVLGHAPHTADFRAVRSLSGAGVPWQLTLASSSRDANVLLRGRRNYTIAALSIFMVLVLGACYAIARGALREAAAGRLQGDFVSAVSHEFRSPLTALGQLTELLADGRVQDEGRRRLYFDVLLKETSRLHRLVEDLLDFGRSDVGRQRYRPEALDLNELVRDGIHEYQQTAAVQGHRIEFATEGHPVLIEADREALNRVVRNLVDNAMKYSPGAPAIWVEVGCEAPVAVLRVRDEGMGVPAGERTRIFEKFVRGTAATTACIQGTGIGLAMVREIIHAHRGTVELQSEVARGSTFVVRVPLVTNASRKGLT